MDYSRSECAKKFLSVIMVIAVTVSAIFSGAVITYADESEESEGSSLPFVFDDSEEPVFYSDPSVREEEEDQETDGTVLSTLSSDSDGEAVLLDEGIINYTSANTVTMQIPNESRNGIYFLSGTSLGFYSLDEQYYETVYTFGGCTSAYEANDKLYVLYRFVCYVYDLNSNSLEQTISFDTLSDEDEVSSTTAVGADSSGRIYLATYGYDSDYNSVYQLWLYDAEGELLSSVNIDARVYSFDGFDDYGNFYMESYYNWVYWGYDHPGRAVTMGNVTDNEISFTDTASTVTISGILTYYLSCLEYICQSSYYLHQKGADVIGGRYLVTASTTYGRVMVADMESMEYVLYLSRSAIETTQTSTYYDLNSIGVRTVYNEANDSIVIYENSNTLNEYDIETGEVIGTYTTEHPVFNLLTMGDNVIAIEKEDGSYYMEIINWTAPTDLSLEADSLVMASGESQVLDAVSNADYDPGYIWSSSDSSVVSVTSEGKITAWSEGSAVITCTTRDGEYSDSITITVSGSTVETPSSISDSLSGTVTDNVSDNNYTYWSSVVDSYLAENDDGTLTRVEYTGSSVLVETYSSDHELLSTNTISMQLSIFGGFYSGSDYNYLVFGQSNTDEDDELEVIRVVKYSKSWTQISVCSISAVNTYVPFSSGSLRMTELNGFLYIYTCHTMYDDGDGYNHQANMTFVIDEDTMTVTDSYYEIMNNSYGYVSHSFNQFIQTDGEYIYRVDHGDAYPRGIYLSKVAVGDSVTDVSYTTAFSILGTSGANATGVSVGGMELSDDNVIIVGNSVDQSSSSTYSASGQRNIFITVTDKEYLDSETIWLTDYDSDDGITPRTPQLVKLSDDAFLIMWEEYDSSTKETTTRAVTINGEGEQTSSCIRLSARLSDCQPIVTSDGLVKWYVSDGSDVTIYQLNPYDLKGSQKLVELYGSDRYETMTEIAQEAFGVSGSVYAVLASGSNFPDALAAAALAGVLDAPVILVSDSTISDALEELEELGVTDVYIAGGTSTVSSSIESKLTAAGIQVERLWGETRQETAIEIANEVLELSGSDASDTCLIASGTSFPDALCGSPYSYWSSSPIYLTEKDGSLSDEVLSAIKEGGYSNIIVLGGTSSVSEEAFSALEEISGVSVTRLGGLTRYETSELIAEWSVSQGMSYDGLAVATGRSFPDSLTGAALCGKNGSVLLLSASTVSGSSVLFDVLSENSDEISYVYILGGKSSVSSSIRTEIRSVLS